MAAMAFSDLFYVFVDLLSSLLARSPADFRNSRRPGRLRRWNRVKRFTVLYNYLDRDSIVLPHLHLRLDLPRLADTYNVRVRTRILVRISRARARANSYASAMCVCYMHTCLCTCACIYACVCVFMCTRVHRCIYIYINI